MASRLSENSIKASYDAGHAGVAWTPPKANENLMLVDFGGILQREDAKEVIQGLPPQLVYHAIKVAGSEVAAEVVPLLSTEQVTRILDYDGWRGDELSPERALQWLRHFKVNGPEGMAEKFSELEEEYQISIMRRYLKTYEKEEMEKLPDSVQDGLFTLPCNNIFYQIDSEDKELVETINELIQSGLALDIPYTYSLLAHSSWAIPNENEAHLRRFREARMEEDGFVSYEESLRSFVAIDVEELRSKWRTEAASGERQLSLKDESDSSFFDNAIFYGLDNGTWGDGDAIELQQRILHLANSICAAAKIEPDDLIGLNRILEQTKALMSLGLDYVANGNPVAGLEIIRKESPKTLFRAGLSLIYQLQDFCLNELAKSGLNVRDLEKLQKAQKWGQILWLLDTEYREKVGFQATEVLKALFNRFPMRPYEDKTQEVARLKFKPVDSVIALNALQESILGMVINGGKN